MLDEIPLRELPVLALDCQSTGATPARGDLLEVGWAGRGEAPASVLVALPEGRSVPRVVTRVTGISDADLEDAVRPEEAWRRLSAASEERAPAVAHYARFEDRFLRDLHDRFGEGDFPFDLVCTHEIARRLLPELPRRGLRALSGYFGAPIGMLRRSADHVTATQRVWDELVTRLDAEGVSTLAELRAWIDRTSPAKPIARGWPMPAHEKEALVDAPGVYRMRRIDESLLYVGKARSLKKRVRSYFQKRRKIPERTLEMLTQARRLDVTVTKTAVEAALLEHDEIKDAQPPYNVALREDHRLCWADPCLRETVGAYDAAHPVGPLLHERVVAGLPALVEALIAARATDRVIAGAAVALGLDPAWAPDDATFAAGARFFADRHRFDPSLEGLLAVGRAVWPLPKSDGDGDPEAPEGWTPETVADFVEERFARAAHARRRARWLTILAEASVAWTEGDRRRALVLEGGEVIARAWTATGAAPPCPPGHARSAAARRARFDRARRDRLRVLTTELRRLVEDGADPAVRTGRSAIVGGADLARLLRWI